MPRAAITSRRDAGGGLVLVGLDPGEREARAYVEPGQVVEVHAPTEHGYFVLASEVGARPWELLVRNTGEAADLLVSTPIGATVEITPPFGPGFPRASLRGRPLVIAVVASALGVARALVHWRIASAEQASTRVLLGVRAAVDVPLAAEVEAWITAGIEVVLCLSRSELEQHSELVRGATRRAGYVQAVLARMSEEGRFAPGTVVTAAGPEAMLADMRREADRAGKSSLEVLTNTG